MPARVATNDDERCTYIVSEPGNTSKKRPCRFAQTPGGPYCARHRRVAWYEEERLRTLPSPRPYNPAAEYASLPRGERPYCQAKHTRSDYRCDRAPHPGDLHRNAVLGESWSLLATTEGTPHG